MLEILRFSDPAPRPKGEDMTEECDRVWVPIRALEIPGSRRQMGWGDVGRAQWFER